VSFPCQNPDIQMSLQADPQKGRTFAKFYICIQRISLH